MRRRKPNRLKKIIVSIPLGFVLCALSTALLMTYLFPSNWVARGGSLPLTDYEPLYIETIAPELRQIQWHAPSTGNGSFLFYHINVGVDMMVYSYGSTKFPTRVTPWDPTVSDIPNVVRLSRFRFGWPMRMLHFDDFSTGQSTANPLVAAYHQKGYGLAGSNRGLDRPAWLPGFIPLYRVPIATNWFAVFVNILVWSAIVYSLLSTQPLIRRWIEHKRSQLGLCVECKYPLNGLEQCPECGTPCT